MAGTNPQSAETVREWFRALEALAKEASVSEDPRVLRLALTLVARRAEAIPQISEAS
jgi:hypothetical protein